MGQKGIGDLEAAIGEEHSPWHEYNLDRAAEILSSYSGEQWDVLACQQMSRPPYWQERCAETLGAVGGERAAELLTTLLTSNDLQVASIAASELDELEISLPAVLLAKLQALHTHLAGKRSPRRDDVARLISRLVR